MGISEDQPTGPLAVGLMALHDRKFFERLLENPREAMDYMVDRGELDLTDADKEAVIRLIAKQREANPDFDALKAWDRYHRTGFWGAGWVTGWDFEHRRNVRS
jgi:hypothetical protein